MDAKRLFLSALGSASQAVSLVGPEDYRKPTPDSEWNIKRLSWHMLYELCWTADLVKGKTISEVGNKYDGDLIGHSDVKKKWYQAKEQATLAVKEADLKAMAHLSYGDVSVDYYLKQAAADQLIHSWDLSTAQGRPVIFPTAVAIAIYDYNYPRRHQMSSTGLFKEPLEADSKADIQTKLLALFGRDINWRP